MLENIRDWKAFERFAADLLAAEGFDIESEPSVDTTGVDFVAVETYRTHDPHRTIRVRWRVQCKHYAGSGRNLGREEIEAAVYSYETRRKPHEGLFLIVSSDYTEPGRNAIDAYVESRKDARVTLWNGRQLVSKLTRHPELLHRYGLSSSESPWTTPFEPLRAHAMARVLFVSDQSAFAHELASTFRSLGMELVFLPVWNYTLPDRLALFLSVYAKQDFDLVLLFLGDTFQTPLPLLLEKWIVDLHTRGSNIALFPFVAWLLDRRAAQRLAEICPVSLLSPGDQESEDQRLDRLTGGHRKGDFRWLAAFDSFVEDQYVEYEAAHGLVPLASAKPQRFGLTHTFELLQPKQGAKVLVKDTSGNPLIVTSDHGGSRVAYINSCCHACLSTVPVASPLSASPDFSAALANLLAWLLERRAS